jgi:VWFA-related protein
VLSSNPRSLIPSIRIALSVAFSASVIISLPGNPQSQQPSPPAHTAPPTPLRVTTRLVQISVIVNDKRGSPMTGLRKEDFTLLDNKKPQTIHFFSMEGSVFPNPPAPPLRPDTYTNRPAGSSAPVPAVTAILFDALNTERTDQALARKQVLRVLDQLPPQTRVALYWLGNGLYVLSDFTTDAAIVRQALANYQGDSSRQLANSQESNPQLNTPNPSLPVGATTSREAFRAAFDQRVANSAIHNRVGLTLASLVTIAQHIRAVQGRKNLIWVSSSFPLTLGQERFDLNWANDTGETFQQDLARATRVLTDANVAVYPVDARGILGADESAAGDFTAPPPPEFASEGNGHVPSRVAPGNIDTMKILAERTGGHAFYGTNDLTGAILRALNDSRVTYTLSFYPSDAKWDGSFHTIRVKVNARGAEVRARSGYFAFPDAPLPSANSDRAPDHAMIAQLAASQLPATGIGVTVRVESLDQSTLIAEAHLDLREINMQPTTPPDSSHRAATLQSIFLQLDASGRIIHVDDRTFHPEFDATTYQQALQRGLTDTRRTRVLPNAKQLCIVVRDLNSSKMGSLYIPLTKYFPRQVKE